MLKHLTIAALMLAAAASTASAAEMAMGHGKPASPAAAANDVAMRTMMKRMALTPSGNADKDFARMMLAHHQGAVAMAEVELRYGKDPELRTLATNIVASQTKEIAQMQSWLAAH